MVGDREIAAFRRGYYGLLSRAFLQEPDAAFLHILREGVDDRIDAALHLSPTLAEGWRAVRAVLIGDPDDGARLREAVTEEYNLLFVSPYQPAILPYESWYMEKELFGPSLAGVRGFLGRVGLEKREDLSEPEDHISCGFETMAQLISRQTVTSERAEEERWLHLQGEFLRSHLLAWVPLLCRELEQHQDATFYRGIAILTRGFVEVEEEALAEWGPPAPKREPLARPVERWSGPTFDLLRIAKKEGASGQEGEESQQEGSAAS